MYDAKEAGKDRYAIYERGERRREVMSPSTFLHDAERFG